VHGDQGIYDVLGVALLERHVFLNMLGEQISIETWFSIECTEKRLERRIVKGA